MKITYYQKNNQDQKNNQGGIMLAHFGVYIQDWHLYINNIAILSSKDSGWYIVMPSFKNKETDKWKKTVVFDKEAQQKFLQSARKAVEDYAKKHNEDIV